MLQEYNTLMSKWLKQHLTFRRKVGENNSLPIGLLKEYLPRRPNRPAQLDTLSHICLADNWTPAGPAYIKNMIAKVIAEEIYPGQHH
jgi:hypothetical protein